MAKVCHRRLRLLGFVPLQPPQTNQSTSDRQFATIVVWILQNRQAPVSIPDP